MAKELMTTVKPHKSPMIKIMKLSLSLVPDEVDFTGVFSNSFF